MSVYSNLNKKLKKGQQVRADEKNSSNGKSKDKTFLWKKYTSQNTSNQ